MAAEVTYQFAPLTAMRDQPLGWVQTSVWKRHFELRAGEHVLAVMQWDGMFKSSATMHSAAGIWHLSRHGFFNWHTDLHVGNAAEPALMLYHRWNRSETTLPDGRVLHWRPANFWATRYSFFDTTTNRALITFHHHGIFKSSAEVTIDAESYNLPYLTMLLALGWYQYLMQMGDSAAVAAAS